MDARMSSDPTLHVFQQDGEWHWAITVPRPTGNGKKVVAYSFEGFGSEQDARKAGLRAMQDGEWRSPDAMLAEMSGSNA